MKFLKKFVAFALVLAAVLSIGSTSLAEEINPLAATKVNVGWVKVALWHEGHAPVIRSEMSDSSSVVMDLNFYDYAEIKMDTNDVKWVRCRVGTKEGYMSTAFVNFSSETFFKACFGGYTLVRGFEGQPVRNLQIVLNKAGYSLTVDGVFGSGTEDAVENFQMKNVNLTTDGKVGPKTAAALMEYWV